MTKHFLVFQHAAWERPGTHLLHSAKRRGVRLTNVEIWHQPIPDVSPHDGLIVLGGSPNVDQEAQYHFLEAEKRAIRQVVSPDGTLMVRSDLLNKEVLYGSIYLIPEKTFYTRFGNLLLFLYFGIVISFTIAYLVCKRFNKTV